MTMPAPLRPDGHTPLPWRVRVNPGDSPDTCDLSICGDIFVLADINGPQYEHQRPNAEFIVRACNAHYELLAALKAFNFSESAIIGGTADTLTLRVPIKTLQDAAAAIARAEPPAMSGREKLCRFGHHPEPAIDFCIEVERLEGVAHNALCKLTGFGHEEEIARLDSDIEKALDFRVGVDAIAIDAKAALRDLATKRGFNVTGEVQYAGQPVPRAEPQP